jgi:hypothetical protein
MLPRQGSSEFGKITNLGKQTLQGLGARVIVNAVGRVAHGVSPSLGFGLHRLMQPWPSPRAGVCKRKAKPAKFSGLSQRATESRKIFDLFCL